MPKQTTLMGWGLDVQEAGDGMVLVFVDEESKDVMLAPMSRELAQQIGHKLSAPSIEVGNSGNVRSILSAGR